MERIEHTQEGEKNEAPLLGKEEKPVEPVASTSRSVEEITTEIKVVDANIRHEQTELNEARNQLGLPHSEDSAALRDLRDRRQQLENQPGAITAGSDITPVSINEENESRGEQSSGSRLAEYLTGLRPNDPKMVERLI